MGSSLGLDRSFLRIVWPRLPISFLPFAGSRAWAAAAALAYAYLAAAWGGYVFCANLVPLAVLASLALGRRNDDARAHTQTTRLRRAYTVFYPLSVAAAVAVPAIGSRAYPFPFGGAPEHVL